MPKLFFTCVLSYLLFPIVVSQSGQRFTAAAEAPLFAANQRIDEKDKIEVQAITSQDKVHNGATFFAMLLVNIQGGWHINSAAPSDENMIATSVETPELKAITVLDIRFPKGIERTFGFSDRPLDVYEGTFRILMKLRAGPGLKSGTYLLPVDITYQACNDNICLPPRTRRVSIPILVVPSTDRVVRINKDLFHDVLK